MENFLTQYDSMYYWARKFSIFLAYVCALQELDAENHTAWVRKFSICEDFSSVRAFVKVQWRHKIIPGEEIFHL